MSGVRKLRLISRSPCVCCTTSTTCRHGYCLGRSLHQRLRAVKPPSQEKRVLALSRDHIPKLLKELFVASSAKVASRANLVLAASKVDSILKSDHFSYYYMEQGKHTQALHRSLFFTISTRYHKVEHRSYRIITSVRVYTFPRFFV